MNVFVYGTLLIPEIWNAVTGEPGLAARPATLPGYRIRRVRNAAYPGIVAAGDGESVAGKVVFEVPDLALRRLDAYEDAFYRRSKVYPETADGSRVSAQAYLVPVEVAELWLSDEPWTLEWFEANELDHFRRQILAR